MSKELLEMIEAVAYEKNMPVDTVREAVESAIAALARKEQKIPQATYKAFIENDGSVDVVRVWEVVENEDEIENEFRQILNNTIEEPVYRDKDSGEAYEDVPTPQWTRQGLQIVKQVLAQRMRQGLRQNIEDEWVGRVGDVVNGIVKRIDRGNIYIDLGEPVEGVLSGKDKLPGEMLKIGNRVKCLVTEVDAKRKGAVVTLTRTSEEFVRELIAIEVPEIALEQVIIKNIAREPGSRTKVIVDSGHGLRVPATSVCIGMRGVRAQSISNELNGERIEFIQWDESLVNLAISCLSPLIPKEVSGVVIDENENKMIFGIKKDSLARAIGARGQNVRLASKILGMEIELLSSEDFEERKEMDEETSKQTLMELMDMDEDMASYLVEEGFGTIEDIYMCEIGELLMLDGVDEEIALMLKERAGETLMLRQMLSQEPEKVDEEINADSSLDVLGIGDEDVSALNKQDIHTVQDLADCGLMDVEWSEDRDDELSAWIMQSRKAVGMID